MLPFYKSLCGYFSNFDARYQSLHPAKPSAKIFGCPKFILYLLFSVVSGLRVPVEDTDSPQAGTVHSIGQIASKKAFLLFEYESFSSSQKHCFLTGAKRKMLQ